MIVIVAFIPAFLLLAFPAMRNAPPLRAGCATATVGDSLLAVQHERQLVLLDRAAPPIVRSWRWLPADSALCAQAYAAVRFSDVAGDADRLFVYRTSKAPGTTYAVVALAPHPTSDGEWGHRSLCYFDARWRKQGTCLAI